MCHAVCHAVCHGVCHAVCHAVCHKKIPKHGKKRSIAGIRERFKVNAARARLARGYNFTKDFPLEKKPTLVLHVLYFIGDFFYKTRASLARAAFYRGFLL